MSLSAGNRLGVFEVTGPLGVGGMGEVYRARDTRLGREVAIKILPNAFTSDPDRLARFEREARMLATLNHPHIGAIYGLEESGSVRALVLELVEGPTLAERIASAQVPLKEALNIARQIADALDAAHEKGIVHRDLKPANVKITPAGVVKVLDFGLAKAAGDDPSAIDLTHSPTVTALHTRDGVLLGTAAYMSPEQARAQAVDKRTDIWAFGCVLYEMLTGRSPFQRDTVTDTLAAIVEREPEWSALPPSTPPPVRHLLYRCLTKNLKERLRDIGEVGQYLDETASGPSIGPAVPTESPRSRGRRRTGALVGAVVTLAAFAGVAILWRLSTLGPAEGFALGETLRLTFDPGLTIDPSLSADGGLIAYASDRGGQSNLDIYVQQTTGGTALRLTDSPADDTQPDVSPDGSLVAFRSERTPAGVYVVPALGGTARLIAPNGRAPRFSPDGRVVAFETGTQLAPIAVVNDRQVFVVPTTGGAPVRLAANLVNAGGPAWAPDGRSLLVLGRKGRTGADVGLDWWHVSLEPNEPAVSTGAFERLAVSGIRLVADSVTIPYPSVWTSDGVFFSATSGVGDSLNVWHLATDGNGRPTSAPVRLTQGTTIDTDVTVSSGGRVAWAARTSIHAHFGFPIEAAQGRTTGAPRNLRDDAAPTSRSAISMDGRLLIFARYEIASGMLWIKDLQTGVERELVATTRTSLNPAISNDAQWVAYTVTKVETGGDAGLGDGYAIQTNGGTPRKVCENCETFAWTPDGELVINTDSRDTLERINLTTGQRRVLIAGSVPVDRPLFDPDGAWMTFNVPGRTVVAPIYADRPTPESEWTTVITTTSPSERTAGLSPDGGLLYLLLEPDGFRCLYALKLDRGTGRPLGEPSSVVHVHDASLRWGSTGYGSAVAAGLFVADLYESRGNIWMSQLVGRQ